MKRIKDMPAPYNKLAEKRAWESIDPKIYHLYYGGKLHVMSISSLFYWSLTPEEHDFWEDVYTANKRKNISQ